MNCPINVYHTTNPHDNDNFYTTDKTEYDAAASPQVGCIGQGVAFTVMKDKIEGTEPLHRLVNGDGQHFYCWSQDDVAQAAASGYYPEKPRDILGYVWTQPAPGLVRIYRGSNAQGLHLYTKNDTDLTTGGYTHEDKGDFYVMPGDIELKYTYNGITYPQTEGGKPTPKHTASAVMKVNGGADGTATAELVRSYNAQFHWGLTQSISVTQTMSESVTVGASGGIDIPFLAEAKGNVSGTVTLSTEIGLTAGAQQDWTEDSTQTFSVSAEMSVSKGERKQATMFVEYYDNITTDFILHVLVQVVADGKELSSVDAAKLLSAMEPDLKVTGNNEQVHYASVELKGKFWGKYGVDAVVNFDEVPTDLPTSVNVDFGKAPADQAPANFEAA